MKANTERQQHAAAAAPDRDAVGGPVADPQVEPGERRENLAGGEAGVLAQAAAVREREARDERAAGVVGSKHRRPDLAAETERPLPAGEARLRLATLETGLEETADVD